MQDKVPVLQYIISITPHDWFEPDQDPPNTEREILERWMEWPPDLFLMTSMILKKTGAYIGAILPFETWPKGKNWQKSLDAEKDNWYRWVLNYLNEADSGEKIPDFIDEHIETLLEHSDVSLDEIRNLFSAKHRNGGFENEDERAWKVCKSLLELHAFADEICRNFGTPSPANWADEIEQSAADSGSGDKLFRDYKRALQCIANILLTSTGTLSRISPDIAKVLPKLRTPNVGLTLRNLSHHVTMHQTEVDVVWRTTPWVNIDEDTINILIVPWPTKFEARWVRPSLYTSDRESQEQTRFFEYTGPEEEFRSQSLLAMIDNAEEFVNRVHIVIFPELALTKENQKQLLNALANKKDRNHLPMVLTGIRSQESSESKDHLSNNSVVLSTFFAGRWYELRQNKHHRWKIDDWQIDQYRLSGVLPGNRNWWEAIPITPRKLSVLAPNKWLALCPLICEDLARQEPVSELIRGIGPTLVTAILLDGPQLEHRWSGRYASVLADDPGSSVLTVSSLGLARRSIGRQGEKNTPVVALWKDNVKGAHPIKIESEQDLSGVILTVTAQWKEESTADGRTDNNSAAVLVHQGENIVNPKSRQEDTSSDTSSVKANSEPNREYNLSDDDDFLEITLFSYFVDATLEAESDVVEALRRWMVGVEKSATGGLQDTGIKRIEDSHFHLWDKISGIHSILNPGSSQTNNTRENLKPFLDWYCLLIKRIKAGDDTFNNLNDIVTWAERILGVVNSEDFVTKIFEEQDPFTSLREDACPIPLPDEITHNVDEPTQVRIFIYGCLAMLWAVHARLNVMRRNGLLKKDGTALLDLVEKCLNGRHDDQWYRALEMSSNNIRSA